MARGQDNGITILLGLKDYKVGGEERVIVEMSHRRGRKRSTLIEANSAVQAWLTSRQKGANIGHNYYRG